MFLESFYDPDLPAFRNPLEISQLKIFRNFTRKETPAQVFSYEFFEIFENTSFKEHFQSTASFIIAWNTKSLSFVFFLLTFAKFIYLVHLAYVFVLFMEWLRSYKYILTLT